MKCANCDSDALFEYAISKNTSIFYCGKDLPGFLNERRKAGLLKITSKFTESNESAISALSSSPEVDAVEESAPKPVKKATKKSAK